MADAFIIDACRTPRGIGKQGKGALSHLHPQHLGSTVLRRPPGAQRDRLGRSRRRRLGHEFPGLRAVGRHRPHVRARRGLRRQGQRGHAGSILRLGHHQRRTSRRRTAIMAGMEDLVIAGGTEMMSLPKKGMMPMGAGQQAPAGAAPAAPPGRVRGRHRHAGRDPTRSARRARPRSRSGGPATGHRGGALRQAASSPSHNLDGSELALDHEEFPRPGTTAEALASCRRASPPWPTTGTTATTRPSASS